MASEQAFWKNFCEAVGRMELFEKWPGSKYADHARNNRELQKELKAIFAAKTAQEWIALGAEKNFPIAPVNSPKTVAEDPQFKDRFRLYPHEKHGVDMLPYPVKFRGEELPEPGWAPTVGEHAEQVLRETLGYDDAKIAQLKQDGALG
jgi:crotonobetainyl-CoA:carnitine CoA-transferase CaiB-like acyl-CoA transferase